MPFTKLTTALGIGRRDGGERYTDTNEFLSPLVLVAYHARPAYPTAMMRNAVGNAAIQARNIVRIANDILAGVVLLRKDEPQLLTDTVARHYGLILGRLGPGLPPRASWLADNSLNRPFSLRAPHAAGQAMVSRQYPTADAFAQLSSRVYLIDMDTQNRNVQGGALIMPGTALVADGYVYQRGDQDSIVCGFKNGEIHVDFNDFPNYSLNSCARVIIHEAAHKYLGMPDRCYANAAPGNYPPPNLPDSLDNADSIAWAAVSLATGTVKMATHNSNDWNHCPGMRL